MRKTLLATLAVAVLLGAGDVCPAQPPGGTLKPLVTVSVSGYDALLSDVKFIGNLANQPQLAAGLEGLLTMMTQGKGLAGVDKTKPWGALVQTDGQQFPMFVFIPVTDAKQLVDLIAQTSGTSPTGPNGGVYQIPTDGPALSLKEQGGWAFISNDPTALANLPADPAALLDGLDKKYDVAVRASVKNVPMMYRQMILGPLQMGLELGMQRMPNETDEQFAIRKKLAQNGIKQITTALNEMDEVLLGWAVDQTTKSSYLDVEMTAIEGTETAKQFAAMGTANTDFGGFDLPGAALTGNWAGTLADSDVESAKAYLATLRTTAMQNLRDQALPGDKLQLAEGLLGDLFDVVIKTIEAKKADAGVAIMLEPDGVTLLIGGVLVEGAKLENALKQLVAEIKKDEPQLGELVKLDAETHAGVRFHTAAVPVPDPKAVALFGPTLEVVVGINETSVYVAAGRNAAETLKKVIDASKAAAGKQIPPARISIAAGKVAQFVAAVSDDNPQAKQIATMIGAMLQQTDGKDHITIVSEAISNGAKTRLELEEGILKLIGSLNQMMSGAAPPPGNSPF